MPNDSQWAQFRDARDNVVGKRLKISGEGVTTEGTIEAIAFTRAGVAFRICDATRRIHGDIVRIQNRLPIFLPREWIEEVVDDLPNGLFIYFTRYMIASIRDTP